MNDLPYAYKVHRINPQMSLYHQKLSISLVVPLLFSTKSVAIPVLPEHVFQDLQAH